MDQTKRLKLPINPLNLFPKLKFENLPSEHSIKMPNMQNIADNNDIRPGAILIELALITSDIINVQPKLVIPSIFPDERLQKRSPCRARL